MCINIRKRPGGELARRPLHFFFIVDCSGSMSGEKIAAVNMGIREAIPHMQDIAEKNPYAEVMVRAIKFSSGAQWHIGSPTAIESFKWIDLMADGVTDMGDALKLLSEEMKIPPMTDRALPPVLVLFSDGQPTDNYEKGLEDLMKQQWGKKAVRIAIAIGHDADNNVLQKFIGHSEIKPLQANNTPALVNYIKWASTAVLKAASSPASQSSQSQIQMNVPLPPPPVFNNPDDDVW